MEDKGFFGMLFDLSFTEFVTTRIIKLLFVLGVLFSGIGAIMLIVRGFSGSPFKGILCLFLSPIAFVLYVLLTRIWCELIIVVFRIAENTGRLVEQGKPPAADTA